MQRDDWCWNIDFSVVPSVLWRCWLGGRKGIQPVKNLSGVVLAWLSVWSEMHMAQLMPLPLTVSCFSKIQIGFTFLVPAHPGSHRKWPLNGCVCVCTSATLEVIWFGTGTFVSDHCVALLHVLHVNQVSDHQTFCLRLRLRLWSQRRSSDPQKLSA